MFLKKLLKKKEDNKVSSSRIVTNSVTQNLKEKAENELLDYQPEEENYPGVQLEDYYIYYLKDSLRDSMATRAKVLYITKKDVLIEINKYTALNSVKKELDSDKGFELAPIAIEELFEIGKDVQLKLQVPFRNEFIRSTGRILEFYENTPNIVHVKLKYTKILGGDNEILFDTILDMLI